MKFQESEFYRKWAVAGMPKDKQKLAEAAWLEGLKLPDGYAQVPIVPTVDMLGAAVEMAGKDMNLHEAVGIFFAAWTEMIAVGSFPDNSMTESKGMKAFCGLIAKLESTPDGKEKMAEARAWAKSVLQQEAINQIIPPNLIDAFNGKIPMPEPKALARIARQNKIEKALTDLVRDLEQRSNMKIGDNKGLVDFGHGVYLQAKSALTEIGHDADYAVVPRLMTDSMAEAFDPKRKISMNYLRNGWMMAVSVGERTINGYTSKNPRKEK